MRFIRNQAIIERCAFSVTGLAVNYIVYDEGGNVHASGATAEIGATAVYWITFTPDNAGDWTLYFYCTATGERHTFHYPVYDANDASSGTHNIEIADDVDEEDVVEITATNIYSLSFYIDLTTLEAAGEGGTVTVRLYNMIDAVNYREVAYTQYVVGTSVEHPNIEYWLIHHHSKITIQCSSAVTAQRACPFRIITETRGA